MNIKHPRLPNDLYIRETNDDMRNIHIKGNVCPYSSMTRENIDLTSNAF